MKNIKAIGIVGMGLIGGSIAMALKNSDFCGDIIGMDVNNDYIKTAKEMEIIDEAVTSMQDLVDKSDLLFIATPINHYKPLFLELGPLIEKDKHIIITDVGSVKGYVQQLAQTFLPKSTQFIGGHPMAGSERSGFNAGNPFLFENAYYFLTPADDISEKTLSTMKELISKLGAYPVITDAEKHDKIVARISHTPHLLAVILSNLIDMDKGMSCLPFVGGGFRDTTRIAAGNPEMWKAIFMGNKQELMKGIDDCMNQLTEVKQLLLDGEEEKISDLLERAKFIRDCIPKYRKDYIPPLYEMHIGVEDKPGVLGELTKLLGQHNINIKDIEIVHARADTQGAIKVSFEGLHQLQKAHRVLKESNYKLTYMREDNENA
ncbi:prephenate dehydrogenase [Serpentinicella sp. ANB-PHB4]|uniref:prephenate dehydrogenase n=1 Tax=Serpentinicella sp. ANB-PHB4 TaxID=3074076 RepID=UPI002862D7AB|nr:prephenate dehydrogenase [Serpentinicella sp. ANB-PHB4]MDR5658611.1 prephenate dehydrogenase [Serpentinicella sp. ANB-PHB4]